jgi:hypothetical protein
MSTLGKQFAAADVTPRQVPYRHCGSPCTASYYTTMSKGKDDALQSPAGLASALELEAFGRLAT